MSEKNAPQTTPAENDLRDWAETFRAEKCVLYVDKGGARHRYEPSDIAPSIDAVLAQVAALREERDALKGELVPEIVARRNAEAEVTRLTEALVELQTQKYTQFAAMQERVEDLADEVTELEAEIAALREQLNECEHVLTDTQTERDMAEAEVQRLTESVQTVREKAFDEIAAHFNRYFDGDIRRELAALRTAGEGR